MGGLVCGICKFLERNWFGPWKAPYICVRKNMLTYITDQPACKDFQYKRKLWWQFWKKDVCVWYINESMESEGCGLYDTHCGEGMLFNEGDAQGNGFKFCPFCGRLIVSVHLKDKEFFLIRSGRGKVSNHESD